MERPRGQRHFGERHSSPHVPGLADAGCEDVDGVGTACPYEAFEEKRMALSEAPGVNQLGRIGKGKGRYEQTLWRPVL